jgi:hypothetical protein
MLGGTLFGTMEERTESVLKELLAVFMQSGLSESISGGHKLLTS